MVSVASRNGMRYSRQVAVPLWSVVVTPSRT